MLVALNVTKMILDYKGTSVFYTDEGKGSTLVLLHGFLENSTMWGALKPTLLKRNRVVCIDLLGHGQTECFGYVHSMDLMAEVVSEVLHHLKIRRSIFIGHSMGGYVALAFAEQFPDNVKGLCLLNSTSRADSQERMQLRDRAVEAVKTNYSNLVKMSISNLFRPKNRTLFQDEIKAVKKEALKTPLQGYIAAQKGMKMRFDREALLHFSPYPKLMILGKKDPILNYEELLDQIKGTQVEKIELPDGHMSHIENQQEVIVVLQEFIKKC